MSVVGAGDQVQPLEMIDQHWSVFHPPGLTFVRNDSRMQAVDPLGGTSLLERLQEDFSAGSRNTFFGNVLWVVGAIAVIAVFVHGYRRWGASGIGVSFALLLAIGVIGALIIPATMSVRESARLSSRRNMAAVNEDVYRTFPWRAGGPGRRDAPASTVPQQNFGGRVVVEDDEYEIVTQPDPNDDSGGNIVVRRRKRRPGSGESEPGVSNYIDSAGDVGDLMKEKSESVEQQLPALGTRAGGEVDEAFQQGSFDVPRLLTAPANAPGDTTAGGQNARVSQRGDVGGGARLSISIDPLQTDGLRRKRFRYLGSAADADVVRLDLGYQDRDAGTAYRLCALAAALLMFWFLRRRSVVVRGFVAAAGITLPLALISIVPVSWRTVLDGLFLGAAGGIGLWCAAWFFDKWFSLNRWVAAVPRAGVTTTALAAALLGLLAGDASAETDAKPPGDQQSPRATSVIVPYDSDTDPLSADHIFLPHKEFVTLWNAAYPEKRIRPPAPVEGVLAGATYQAQLSRTNGTGTGTREAQIGLTGRFVLYSFRRQAITLPIPLTGVALDGALLDGRPAPLLAPAETDQGETGPQVVVSGEGSHTLDLTFRLPAELSGPAGQFRFSSLPVPAGRLTFTLPAENLAIRVNGSSGTYHRRRTDEGDEVVEVPINGGGDLTVAWRPDTRQAAAPAAVDTIVHAESDTAFRIEDSGMQVDAQYRFRVRQGGLSELVFSVDRGLMLRQVKGPDVGGWAVGDAVDNDDHKRIRLFLRRTVNDQTLVRLRILPAGGHRGEGDGRRAAVLCAGWSHAQLGNDGRLCTATVCGWAVANIRSQTDRHPAVSAVHQPKAARSTRSGLPLHRATVADAGDRFTAPFGVLDRRGARRDCRPSQTEPDQSHPDRRKGRAAFAGVVRSA